MLSGKLATACTVSIHASGIIAAVTSSHRAVGIIVPYSPFPVPHFLLPLAYPLK